jgi:hypothetical protein
VLDVPALTLPFLRIERLGQSHESNLLGGVRALFEDGNWLVAGIVLLFSVVLPAIKLGTILTLSLSPHWLTERRRGLAHRAVEHMGRWGMLDVLLVAVMIAFVKLGMLVTFSAGPGLVVFAGFVLLSLMASLTFDPHLLWGEPALAMAPEPQRDPPVASRPSSFPAAVEKPKRRANWLWLIPFVALVVAVGLGWASWANRGPLIEISFREGHGLRPGDELRHRGIAIGRVEAVDLAEDGAGIRVQLRLLPKAGTLARRGTQFWIVRPQLDLTGVSGVETLIGAKHLAIAPGPEGGAREKRFVGLDDPPLIDAAMPGAIEIVLQAAQAAEIRSGYPVYYRDLRVGGIKSVRLAADSSAVEIRAIVRPEFRHLLREKTVFWQTSGVTLEGSLTSVRLHVGSLETWLRGGVALAVPDEPGAEVTEGHRYVLASRPDPEWLAWSPVLGASSLTAGADRPEQDAAVLTWTNRGWFRNSARERRGWVTRVGDVAIGPSDLLASSANDAQLAIGGETKPLSEYQPKKLSSVLSTISLAAGDSRKVSVRVATEPEDCLIVSGDSSPLLVAATRLTRSDDVWKVSPGLNVPAESHGAAVIAVSDHRLIGVACVSEGGVAIGLLPEGMAAAK